MNIKRAVLMAVLVLAVASLAIPLAGLRARAAGSSGTSGAARTGTPATVNAAPARASTAAAGLQQDEDARAGNSRLGAGEVRRSADGAQIERLSPDVLKTLGIVKTKDSRAASEGIARRLQRKAVGASGEVSIQSGQPSVLDARSALSAALITTIGGRDNQFSEVSLIADWDGREDCTADREQKLDDFSFVESEIDFTLLRAAISEHTVANGFNENVYYYGDSVGNVWVGVDTNPGVNSTSGGAVDRVLQINLPTVLNAFGTLNSDDQIAITGLAVSPVADLTSFANVNGAFSFFSGRIGEILYVTFLDTEGGLRLTGSNQLVRSGVLAFPIADVPSPAAAPPGILSGTVPTPFPVTVGGAFGVIFTTFSIVGGVAVDDDGNVYFQQADLIGLTGANIVKITDIGSNQDRSLATSGFGPTITTLNPTNGNYGTASGPPSQVNRFTNYSGTSTTFGNIVALDTGPCNVLYAAVARSFVAGAVSFEQLTEGLFPAPAAFAQGLPSMVISFADCSGGFDSCTSPAAGIAGTLPVGDGFADLQPATPGVAVARVPGVNNFRLFVQGDGPDVTGRVVGNATISSSTPANTIAPIVGFQVDFSLHSGIAVNEEGTVFVISGGTPAGIGKNPSPMLGEILCFEDICPMNRRADFVDLRGNGVPNPPNSGGNVGDGDSDRFDHIFFQAPLDQVTLTPGGLAGLATGFLRYTNRLAPAPLGAGVLLGLSGGGGKTVLGDDDTTCGGGTGPIIFENLDPGHQVAGGDDQNFPNRGDDNDGAGTPPLVGLYSGGFEFVFGGPTPRPGVPDCVWNGFCWNSNGNITFGTGDVDNTPTVPEFRTGPPRIAPAWADLNPSSRVGGFLNTFPVMALGFANVNDFRIRWLNVPEFGREACSSNAFGLGGNTFSINLFDDGTGIDENANQPLNPANPTGNNSSPFDLQEGPTDLRFVLEPTTNTVVGCPPRPNGSGIFTFEFCRMELLGTDTRPVITGFSIGGLSALIPPGLCEINLSTAAATAETTPFGVIQGTTAAFCNCCIGEGTEPTLFELFNEGKDASVGSIGQITFATPDFDLRFEGNDAQLCSPIRQRDNNRGKICFLGVGCAPPANPICQLVTPVLPVAVAPGQPAVGSAAAGSQKDSSGNRIATPTSGIINAVCGVQLNILGCGFFPNEVTTICQGFGEETGVPLQRPGKVVSTAVTLTCDFNGDGTPEAVIALSNVTPINCNLVRASVVPPSTSIPGGLLNCTGFPASCCGGIARLTVTTTFTAGDNNVFGPFTRTTFCDIDLGIRAPVVFSVTPSGGPCGILQDVLISGACFCLPDGTPNVTSVFAVSGTTTVQAVGFKILTCNLIDAEFNFTTANAGKTFLVFVSGPSGTSRNNSTAVAGNAFCPASSQGGLGNEQCIQVTFTCNAPVTPPDTGNPPDIAEITSCDVTRDESGAFTLSIIGKNFKAGAAVTIGGKSPRKTPKFKDQLAGTDQFTRITVKKACGFLPGAIVVTNPPPRGAPSVSFLCNKSCATTN